jgi:hypothetical protein
MTAMNIDRLWAMMGLRRIHRPGRYTVLLFSILALMIAQPLVKNHTLAQLMLTLLMSAVLLSALYTFESSRTFFILALIVMVPSLVGRWMVHVVASRPAELFAAGSTSLFLMMTVIGLIVELFTVRRVTLDSIAAAICAYMLMAVAWAFIYAIIEMRNPGSFSAGLTMGGPAAGTSSAIATAMQNFIYYSFVCLTTTGYGDIAPLSQSARMVSVLESITGQLYLAILIARLVSLEVAQKLTGDR